MNGPIKAVLFDLDGTLLDTAQDFHESLNQLRAEENLAPLSFETVRAQVSHGGHALVRPGGHVFISTINRNFRSFALAIVGAEYIANLVPRGTHEYERLLKPSEVARFARAAGLDVVDIAGLQYDPIREQCSLDANPSVNYLMHLTRREAA